MHVPEAPSPHERSISVTSLFPSTSIDHDILLDQLEDDVPDGRVLDLLRQYVRRTIYDGGLYEDVERGISLGCPLSPLMGAFYLKLLDERVETDRAGLCPVHGRLGDPRPDPLEAPGGDPPGERDVGGVARSSSTPTRPSSVGSAGALTSWAMRSLLRGWRSPRRRWNVAWNVCPGFMSEVWT